MIYLGIGSNLGNRLQQLAIAEQKLEDRGIHILRSSAVYETPPFGPVRQGPFLNHVVEVATTLAAPDLMNALLDIEAEMGRRRLLRWGPRLIDLDLLAYQELILESEFLQLPHPGIAERAFVLVPWAQLVPEWRHPVSHLTILDMLSKLPNDQVSAVNWYAANSK